MISNIEKVIAYTETQDYRDRRAKATNPEDKKVYDVTEKVLI